MEPGSSVPEPVCLPLLWACLLHSAVGPFKMLRCSLHTDNSRVLYILTCVHPSSPHSQLSHPPRKLPCAPPSQSSFTPQGQPRICFPSLYRSFASSRTSCKWSPTVTLLYLASRTQFNVSEIHPCCCLYG